MTELIEDSLGFPQELHEQLMDALHDNVEMKESLERIKQQFLRLEYEDAGWARILGGSAFGGEDAGLDLHSIQKISDRLREEVAGSALPKRANEARYAYTFGQPIFIRGLDDQQPAKPKRGQRPALQRFYENSSAQRHLFSDSAKSTMHAASSTDGIFILQGDNATKDIHPIPLSQIADVMTHPDFNDEIWAYRRQWTRTKFNNTTGVPEKTTVSEWVYTDSFPKGMAKAKKIGEYPVNPTKTIIDAVFNRQTGWTFGIPDLMAGQIWNQKYLTMIAYGEQVTETLAYFAAKVKVNSQPGSSNVGLKIGGAGREKGQVLTYGAGNEIDVFSTAGKAYDFGSLRLFSAMYAAAVGVPLTDLSADPSSAGASYGSAAALQPGARRLIEARRLVWADWIKRVLKWATGDDITVTPSLIDEEDPYRSLQRVSLAWNSGLFHDHEIRPVMARVAGIQLAEHDSPEGVMLPNNEKYEKDESEGDGTPKQAASPDQGKKNNTGGQEDTQRKDRRSDTIQNESIGPETW